MPDDVILNSNPLAMFDRITTTVGILRQTFYFMTGFHSRRWYVIHDIPHSHRLGLQFPRMLHARRRLRHGLPKCFIDYAFRHVNNDVGVHCLILILMQYLLQHRGDIRGDVVCHLVRGGISRNIFDAIIANMQCIMRWHVHNHDNIQQGGPNVVHQSDIASKFYCSKQVVELRINSRNSCRIDKIVKSL